MTEASRTTSNLRRHLAHLTLGLAGLVATGCGTGTDRATSPEPAANHQQEAEVDMRLIAFRPETLTVPTGSTVTWTQSDPGFHTVTSGTVAQDDTGVSPMADGRFDSGDVPTGQTFSHTFAEPGSYPYFCALHPATMRGEIRVA